MCKKFFFSSIVTKLKRRKLLFLKVKNALTLKKLTLPSSEEILKKNRKDTLAYVVPMAACRKAQKSPSNFPKQIYPPS